MGIKDVRDALWFMKLVSSDDDVEKIARIIMQYKPEILIRLQLLIATNNLIKTKKKYNTG
jgi:hypothetical protein